MFRPFAVVALFALSAACSSGAHSSPFPPSLPNIHWASNADISSASHPHREHALLFVSDASLGTVSIFGIHSLSLIRTIKGFYSPGGECSDAAGHVWLTTFGGEIDELSHAGKRLRELNESLGYPSSCAVDPTTGDLAVLNAAGRKNSAPGDVLVFNLPSGGYTALSNPGQFSYYYAAYDRSGNLYVDGTKTQNGIFMLSKCVITTSTCSTINITGGTIFGAGFVQWYSQGDYLVVGDNYCNRSHKTCVYSLSISGSTAKVKGLTRLLDPSGGPACDVIQGAISPNGRHLTGADFRFFCYNSQQQPTLERWAFPIGGKPTKYNGTPPLQQPEGAAISVN